MSWWLVWSFGKHGAPKATEICRSCLFSHWTYNFSVLLYDFSFRCYFFWIQSRNGTVHLGGSNTCSLFTRQLVSQWRGTHHHVMHQKLTVLWFSCIAQTFGFHSSRLHQSVCRSMWSKYSCDTRKQNRLDGVHMCVHVYWSTVEFNPLFRGFILANACVHVHSRLNLVGHCVRMWPYWSGIQAIVSWIQHGCGFACLYGLCLVWSSSLRDVPPVRTYFTGIWSLCLYTCMFV